MIEAWIRWIPINGLAPKYYVASICSDEKGLIIGLYDWNNKNNKVRVTFHSLVGTYRNTYETYRSDFIYKLDERYGSAFYGDWTFFKVSNSSYAHWLSEQSSGINDIKSLVHFAFISMETIVDVLSIQEPTVELIEVVK